MLRDRIVCGISETQLQRQLLAESKLMYKTALEIAQSWEASGTNTRDLQKSRASNSTELLDQITTKEPLVTVLPVAAVEDNTWHRIANTNSQSVTFARKRDIWLESVKANSTSTLHPLVVEHR